MNPTSENAEVNTDDVILPRRIILTVSFLQGILMYILFRALEADKWPAQDPVWLIALATALTAIPVFFILLVEGEVRARHLKFLGLYAVIIVAVGAYAGLQQTPPELINDDALFFAFFLTAGIASFKALMYSQVLGSEQEVSYGKLFHYSWRNILLFGLGCLFTGLTIGLLFLWGGLFGLIEIDFFQDLFEEAWFLFPAATTAFGFAIIIFRSLSNVIDSIARLLKTMIRFLLPILALLAVTFVCFLPFTGLQPLWDTRYGSTMMLWLQALLLFAVNAVYQGDTDNHPYPKFIHRLIYAGIAVMPIYSIIAFHGLLTRINQYGLTVSRCWGLIVAFLLACFCIGYLWSIVRKRDHWLHGMAKVNIAMGLIVMSLLVLINSPILNLYSLTANNQLGRVESGRIDIDQLDLSYFRYALGRQGYLALEQVKEQWSDETDIIAEIERLYEEPFFPVALQSTTELETRLTVSPAGEQLPQLIAEQLVNTVYPIAERYHAVIVDLNNDGQDEVFVMFLTSEYMNSALLWTFSGDEWVQMNVSYNLRVNLQDMERALNAGDVEVVEPEWQNLRIGEMEFTPRDY